jgi:hypothetical protein
MYDELIKKSEQLKLQDDDFSNIIEKGNLSMIAFEGKMNDLEYEGKLYIKIFEEIP